MNENHICYICGQPANYQLKNKKWCCQPFSQQCPTMKELKKKKAKEHWSKLKELGYKTQFKKDINPKDRENINKRNYNFFSQKEILNRKKELEDHPESCKCDFCGQQAFFILKNGKYCCSTTSNKCPSIRKKNTKGCLSYFDKLEKQGQKRTRFNYKDLSEETKENMKVTKKGDTIETNPIIAKARETRKQSYEKGKWSAWNKGITETEEHKEAIRKGTIKYLKESGQVDLHAPKRVSIKSIKYIENLNKEKGWNLQHGYDKGEYEVGGYFLDGYDEERNIAFEYDESYHYKDWKENILRERDIQRQEYIIKKIGCEFYRYNERLKLLYKVN